MVPYPFPPDRAPATIELTRLNTPPPPLAILPPRLAPRFPSAARKGPSPAIPLVPPTALQEDNVQFITTRSPAKLYKAPPIAAPPFPPEPPLRSPDPPSPPAPPAA